MTERDKKLYEVLESHGIRPDLTQLTSFSLSADIAKEAGIETHGREWVQYYGYTTNSVVAKTVRSNCNLLDHFKANPALDCLIYKAEDTNPPNDGYLLIFPAKRYTKLLERSLDAPISPPSTGGEFNS